MISNFRTADLDLGVIAKDFFELCFDNIRNTSVLHFIALHHLTNFDHYFNILFRFLPVQRLKQKEEL